MKYIWLIALALVACSKKEDTPPVAVVAPAPEAPAEPAPPAPPPQPEIDTTMVGMKTVYYVERHGPDEFGNVCYVSSVHAMFCMKVKP